MKKYRRERAEYDKWFQRLLDQASIYPCKGRWIPYDPPTDPFNFKKFLPENDESDSGEPSDGIVS